MPLYSFVSTEINNSTNIETLLQNSRKICIDKKLNRLSMSSVVLEQSRHENNKVSDFSLDMKVNNNVLNLTAVCSKSTAQYRYKIDLPATTWVANSANWVKV
jgi:hypothetical protein